jgi:hypothetical protein
MGIETDIAALPPHPPRLPIRHRSAYETVAEHYRFLQMWDAGDTLCRADPSRIRPRPGPHRPALRELMQWSDLSRDACRRHRTAYERELRLLVGAGE